MEQNEKKFADGKLRAKMSKNNNRDLAGYFRLNEKGYFLRITKLKEPDKDNYEYLAWVEEIKGTQEQPEQPKEDIPF